MKNTEKPRIGSAEAHYKLANIWLIKGKTERALAGYEEAVRIQPDYVPAHLELGRQLTLLGKTDEAVEVYRRAVRCIPGEDLLYQKLDRALAEKRESDNPPVDNQKPVTADPKDSRGHILVYIDYPGIYGAGQINHALMTAFAASGYRVTCVQHPNSNYLIRERARLGIDHVWLERDSIYDRTRIPLALTNVDEAKSVFDSTKPDFIIFGDGCPLSSFAAKKTAVELDIPYLILVHCATRGWAKQFETWIPELPDLFDKAQEVISVSSENLLLLRKYFRLPDNRGRVIYNGRPEAFFADPNPSVRSRIRRQFGIPEDAVVAGTAADLDWRKGIHHLIHAVGELQQRDIWSRLYFMLAGSGPFEAFLVSLAINDGNIAEHVKLMGDRDDVPDVLDAFDIFVLPSQYEGMPLAVMEAMAKGLPVIATAVSGIPEELGDTGLLLPDPVKDPQETARELIRALEGLASDQALRREIGMNCKKRANELFREERMIEQYMTLTEDVFSRCHRSRNVP